MRGGSNPGKNRDISSMQGQQAGKKAVRIGDERERNLNRRAAAEIYAPRQVKLKCVPNGSSVFHLMERKM